jgi:hypothetical protein
VGATDLLGETQEYYLVDSSCLKSPRVIYLENSSLVNSYQNNLNGIYQTSLHFLFYALKKFESYCTSGFARQISDLCRLSS